jgi:hypothetical protein
VRIGSYERIHPDIQKYESNTLTANISTIEEIDSFYKTKVNIFLKIFHYTVFIVRIKKQ